jgi:hypothetical protein
MTDDTAGTPLDRLANMNSMLLDATDEKCLDVQYQKMIDRFRKFNFTGGAGECFGVRYKKKLVLNDVFRTTVDVPDVQRVRFLSNVDR